MNEDQIRAIVRDELQRIEQEEAERVISAMRAWALQDVEKYAPSPDDGPTVSEVKRAFRESANDLLGETS